MTDEQRIRVPGDRLDVLHPCQPHRRDVPLGRPCRSTRTALRSPSAAAVAANIHPRGRLRHRVGSHHHVAHERHFRPLPCADVDASCRRDQLPRACSDRRLVQLDARQPALLLPGRDGPQLQPPGPGGLRVGRWMLSTAQVRSSRRAPSRDASTSRTRPPSPGQANALTMSGLKTGEPCSGFECTDLKPDPDPAAGTPRTPTPATTRCGSRGNANLSNPVPPSTTWERSTNPFQVHGTVWTPTTRCRSPHAGEAYFWAVQPCTLTTSARPTPYPSTASTSQATPSTPSGPGSRSWTVRPRRQLPADGRRRRDTVLDDYLETNARRFARRQLFARRHVATQSAREYEVQVENDHLSLTPLDTRIRGPAAIHLV